MKTSIFKIATLTAVLLSSACATTTLDNSIEIEARPLLTSVDAKMFIPQSELKADINMSNAGQMAAAAASGVPGVGILIAAGAGAAGAAADAKVNAERQKSADKRITPVRNKLVGYDYANVVDAKISSALNDIEWLNLGDIVIDKSSAPTSEVLEADFANSAAAAFMSVNMEYAFNADLTHLELDATSRIFPKTAELGAFKHTPKQKNQQLEKQTEVIDAIFNRSFKISVPLTEMSDMKDFDKDAVRDEVLALDRATLVEKLEMAAEQLAAEMASAIRNPELETAQ